MNPIVEKAWRVINSCETNRHARAAMRYLELLSDQYPEIDVSHLRKELITLFDLID